MKNTFSNTQLLGAVAIVFAIGVFVDLIWNRLEPMPLFIAVLLVVFGRHLRKKRKKVLGNVLFVIGIFILLVSIFSSIAFQLVFIMLVLCLGYRLLQRQHVVIKPQIQESIPGKQIVAVEPLFHNSIFGTFYQGEHVYELHDINIRYGVGDVKIDMTTAMIPEGETVFVIHGVVGNIRLYVPYDIELSLSHSVWIGNVSIPGFEGKGSSRNISLCTEQYTTASRRIKIVTSLLVGDVEVKYI